MNDKPSIIPAGVTFRGDVQGDADLLVFGRIDGEIRLSGALVVEESGSVRGEVRARSVTVRGVVVGDAYGVESVRVDDGARMVGDATAPRVLIVEGARFRGRIHMRDDGSPPPRAPSRRRRRRGGRGGDDDAVVEPTRLRESRGGGDARDVPPDRAHRAERPERAERAERPAERSAPRRTERARSEPAPGSEPASEPRRARRGPPPLAMPRVGRTRGQRRS